MLRCWRFLCKAPTGHDVELALNDSERARGLMFREKLGPYDGMLFDFFQEAPVSFWMKNTLISLDMLFVTADGTETRVNPATGAAIS